MKRFVVTLAVVAITAAACGEVAEVSDAAESAESTTTSAVVAETTSTTEPPPAPASEGDDESLFAEDPKTAPSTISPPEEPVTEPAVSHPDADVAIAMTDLVARANVDAADIALVSAEEVTWRDGSLGCPLPGMRYTQALVNGRRIILETGGVQYHYHSGPGRAPFYCANPSDTAPGDGGGEEDI